MENKEETVWAIIDENGMYVHENSIKKCGDEYVYNDYPRMERGYTSRERVQKALECLKLHNTYGGLNHKFQIVEKSNDKGNEEKTYLLVDNNGNYEGQIYLAKWEEDEPWEITYLAEKLPHHASGNIKHAFYKIQQLNELSAALGIKGHNWMLREVNRDEWRALSPVTEKQEYVRPTWQIAKGQMAKTRKAVSEIYKKYKRIFRELEMEYRENVATV